jgi:hypothetical protein
MFLIKSLGYLEEEEEEEGGGVSAPISCSCLGCRYQGTGLHKSVDSFIKHLGPILYTETLQGC